MFELEQIFKRANTVQRYLAAPLAPSRLAYLGHRAEQGFQPSTLGGIAAIQVRAVRYLELGEESKTTPSEIAAAAERWVTQDPARRGGQAATARRGFVSQATGWLRFAGRLEAPADPPCPHAAEVAQFEACMRREHGWSEATIQYRVARAAELLRRACRGQRTLADLSLADIDRALGARNARNGRPRCRATIRNHADALRAFFRFAADRGWCQPGLAATITAPRVYQHAALPAGPSPEALRHLLATTAGERAADRRDRALLLTLCAYGLRAGEVHALRLDDINWEAGTLCVRRPKTGLTEWFPLSRRVAEAMVRYLREVRPQTASRRVFLTLKAPVRPLRASAISSVVRSRMSRGGMDGPRRGAHALRHAFAQRLQDQGFSLTEIGQSLGHRSPEATAVYTQVDLHALRQVVADFDLEGLA